MNDVIVSISTALGKGAISIIRLSGNGSISLVNSVFKGKDLNLVDSHTINYGHIVDGEKIIDEVLVSVMKSPKTYTLEDVVEINSHGGIAVTNRILELLVLKGARLATPGEFTKRAFLNGRIDLTQAEAVNDIIDSKTEKALDTFEGQLNGSISRVIKEFREKLINLIANIEVNIDYPEYEDALDVTIETIKNETNIMEEYLKKIVKESKDKKIIKDGINIAIVGKPNVGKSSILNKIIGENKAIVTDIAGTTRDIVEGSTSLDGIVLNFIDTAGIRDTDDVVEKFGVEKSFEKMEEADLVIVVLNNNEKISEKEKNILDKLKDKKYIVVINKKDLDKELDISSLNLKNVVYTDTISDSGIDSLKDKIRELFNLESIESDDSAFFSNVRQMSLAKEALDIFEDVKRGVDNNIPVDLIEIDIKKIWNKLGEITGETYDDELIDTLFSNFCLGK